MNVEFRRSFVRDLERVRNETLKRRVKEIIKEIERAARIEEVRGVKRLRGGGGYYRIRIGDYRLGLVVEEEKVTLVRFLHRKDVYRYFP